MIAIETATDQRRRLGTGDDIRTARRPSADPHHLARMWKLAKQIRKRIHTMRLRLESRVSSLNRARCGMRHLVDGLAAPAPTIVGAGAV